MAEVIAKDLKTELRLASGLIEHAEADGNTVVTIPENVREKLRGLTDLVGSPNIFNRADEIFEVAGGRSPRVKEVLISERMRLEGLEEAVSVWEPREQRIIHQAIATRKSAQLCRNTYA